MMEKKLSIIVPAYNVERYLTRCLDSLLNQDLPTDEYEVIVVNDGSTDGTAEVLDRYGHAVKVFSTANKGVSEARNYGVRQASGKYFLFVDADDWIKENTLSMLYGRMEKDALDLLVLNFHYWDDKGELPRPLHYTDKCEDRMPVCSGADFMLRCLPPVVWGIVYRLSYWKEHEFSFMPIRHEDEELMPKVFYLAERVGFSSVCFYNYYRNPDSFMMNYDNRSCLYMLRAMKSVEQFRLQRVKGKKMNDFFQNLIARRLLQSFKRSIQWGAPASTQLEMVQEMKKCGLSPLPKGKCFIYPFMYQFFPKLFVVYYRKKLKPYSFPKK